MSGSSKKPVIVGGHELAAIYGGAPRNVSQWIQRGSLTYDDAKVLSGKPYWTLQFAVQLGEQFPRPKEPDMSVVEELIEQQSPGRTVVSALTVHRSDLPAIVGKQEIVAMVGQEATSWLPSLDHAIEAGTFTAPDWRMGGGSPLWLLDNALVGIEQMRAVARTNPVAADEKVVEALRAGTYDGPGSRVLSKGPKKS
ncbi:hypothetical protein [Kitasatospora cheerisanensis]|uniref:Uncharacterized protein n=1 Tax=Kitasatospora cheerisanensis KCTC 2395 TaxID=1348663 RepID=A0A066Z651_9ACTN|nr:hypothetical protein [Kitasatospora cheerisanensis]KDN85645.1 hypothetical protein KCH_25540 [Kitasatospora cheerisanensis KCTC 2395]